VVGDFRLEQAVCRLLERGVHFGEGSGKAFPGADQEWHAGPSLVLDREPRGYVGFDSRIRSDPFLGQVTAILAPHDIDRTKGTYRLKQSYFAGVDRVSVIGRWCFHPKQREDLQQMILEDVPNGADFLVETAATAHAKLLRHRDLHVLDVPYVPYRLQK
jgi:hypothetical protein